MAAPPKMFFTSHKSRWKRLWKIAIPFKYKLLLWNLLHESLPAATSLASKIKNFSPICTRCRKGIENHLHLFRDCVSSQVFWSLILTDSYVSNKFDFSKFYNSDWDDWINFNMESSKEWKVIFGVGIWHIWLARNKFVFQMIQHHAHPVYNRFKIDLACTNNAMQVDANGKGKEKMIRYTNPLWRPLPVNVVKINTDASWRNLGNGTAGVVYRNCNGNWIFGFSMRIHALTAAHAELVAIREGLKVAHHLKLENVQIETDAKSIKDLLEAHGCHGAHELGAIILEVANMMTQNIKVEVLHMTREGNMLAHTMAKHAFQITSPRLQWDSPPS